MGESKKFKGLSYYFRIEFSSLQGKITTGFCILGLISIGLMGLTSTLLKPSLKKSTYINEVIYPSHLQITLLQHHLNRQVTAAREAQLLKQHKMDATELEQGNKAVRTALDSLKALAPHWQNKEEQLSLQMAEAKTVAILEKIEKANNSRERELLTAAYEKDIPLLQAEINQALGKVTAKQSALRKEYNSFIGYRLDNLNWILALCFVGAFAIGTLLGGFIVVKVLAVIKHLKHKILELSEGNLISPIPPSKDELNSIGKAINTLTDNLRDIREFAREVGQGNFDTDISVFNNQNDLGQSLAEMRESLKRVSEDDKIRAWTATGLATFNEFLRNANNDTASFATELTSKVVKYLDLNQGSLYILKEGEHKSAKLELKACYAYDRQKYMEKTIEAGQGFVGQVYLEKEYIYLTDIPERFTSITSGLGEATPKYLLVMPLKVNQQVNGVIELASFTPLPEYKISFMEKLSESISSAIASVQNNQVTQRLLEEARQMAEAMKLQEETLRQNSEELQATQEQLEREIHELQKDLQLTEGALSAEDAPLLICSEQWKIEWANKAAEKVLGSNLQQLKQRSLQSVFSSESTPALKQVMETAGEPHPAEAPFLKLQHTNYQLVSGRFTVKEAFFYSIRLQAQKSLKKSI